MKTYQLNIKVNQPLKVQIGKLGLFDFPKGNYVYTGSAKKNIDARIKRHQSKEKKLCWHIYYLLAESQAQIVSVLKTNKSECLWNQSLNGEVIVNGFDASDCQSGCGSHLVYMGED